MLKLSTIELLLVRKWLEMWEHSVSISSVHIHKAIALKTEVDKELWGRLVSKETPWGEYETGKTFVDDDFENTVKELLKNE
jgi:hypothetical protein